MNSQAPTLLDGRRVAMFALAAMTATLQAAEPLNTRSATLDCGLRVVAVQLEHRECTTVQLWFRVGANDDPPDAPGLTAAALCAAIGRDGWKIDRWIAANDVSGSLWCGPSTSLTENLGAAASMLAPWTAAPAHCSPRPDHNPIEVLVAGDYEELVPRESPEKLLVQRIWANAYGRPSATRRKFQLDANTALKERLQRQLEMEFNPANATLLIAASDAPDALLIAAREAFQSLPPASPRRATWKDRPTFRGGFGLGGIAEYDAVAIAWPTPRYANIELATFDVLTHYLANPVDGPLAESRDALNRPPRALRAFAADAGLFVITLPAIPTDPTSPIAACQRLTIESSLTAAAPAFEALAQVAAGPVDLVRLHRARALAEAHVHARREDALLEALHYGLAEMLGGDVRLADYEAPTIAEVRAADLQALARSLLRTTPRIQPILGKPPVPRAPDEGWFWPHMAQSVCRANITPYYTDRIISGPPTHVRLEGRAGSVSLKVAQAPIARAFLAVVGRGPGAWSVPRPIADYASFHGCVQWRGGWLIPREGERTTAIIELLLQPRRLEEHASALLELHLLTPDPVDQVLADLRAININVTAADR
ncbi:MAG: hypothetical protein SF069_06045 [Phycisphaerae bacterium]|nr:hypothetical protein [Phycisphaerae bacterium]